MTPFFGSYDDLQISEAEAQPVASTKGQRIRVGVVERDNGLVMAKTSQISNALYDLADQNSTTHTVLLPHGTTVKLAAATGANVGSWRARFEVANPKLGKTVECKGTSEASEVAGQIDLLALAKVDKDALAKVTELHDAGMADELMVELGLRESAPLQEIQTHISGYVTKSGKHVGAYSQIRKSIDKLQPGSSVHFPDGIAVRKISDSHYHVTGGGVADGPSSGKATSVKNAADVVASRSAGSTDPKSIGGRVAHTNVTASSINDISNSGDNPKLPGAPHPDDVAARAKKAREGVKLPSRKERARNEQRAKDDKRAAAAKRRRANDESPMPGVIRRPSESDAIRAKGQRSADDGPVDMGKMRTPGTSRANRELEGRRNIPGVVNPTDPRRSKKSGRASGPGAVDDPNGSKIRAASTDVTTFRGEVAKWSEDELRREAKMLPNSSPLYAEIIAALRRLTGKGHPAAKARNRQQGLAESASSGAFFGNW